VEKRLIMFFILTALILFASQKLIAPRRPAPPTPAPEEPVHVQPDVQPAETTSSGTSELPELATPPFVETSETVEVETQDMRIVLSNVGGGIVLTELKHFDDPEGGPVRLVNEGMAATTILKAQGEELPLDQVVYGWSKRTSTTAGIPETVVEFACSLAQEGRLLRRYRFPDAGYVFSVEQELEGHDVDSSAVAWHAPLRTTERNTKDDLGYFSVTGRSQQGVEKVKLSGLRKEAARPLEGEGFSWLAARSKYFMAAVIPEEAPFARAVAARSEQGVGMTFTAWSVGNPQSYRVYLGPISPTHLRELEAGLDVVAEFGASPLRPISRLMLSYITFLYRYMPNYGVVVILLAITIKILFWPLTHKSYESMKRMQQLQPLINELREKHKNNPQALQKATMDLYKEHKVSPLGGCLPMLLQMPVFFALYPLLRGTIELRGAAFLGWIQDLSAPDPYYVLPIVMGVAMFVQQKMTTVDKRQAAMMYIMPIFLTYIFLRLPAGLVLYWLVFNVLSIGQQALMKSRSEVPSPAPAKQTGARGRSQGGSRRSR
jgi:YidC/Oxa1 family membrane protein insertase